MTQYGIVECSDKKSHVGLYLEFKWEMSSNKQNMMYIERHKLKYKQSVEFFCYLTIVFKKKSQIGCVCKELTKIP